MKPHIICSGSSIEADGVFSHLHIGRDIAADPRETTCHIIIDGAVAEAILLGEVRDQRSEADGWPEPRCGKAALDELLALIAGWADARLASVMSDPASRSGRGIIDNYGSGGSSCEKHPLATSEPPKVVGLDRAQELAQAANQAAA